MVGETDRELTEPLRLAEGSWSTENTAGVRKYKQESCPHLIVQASKVYQKPSSVAFQVTVLLRLSNQVLFITHHL